MTMEVMLPAGRYKIVRVTTRDRVVDFRRPCVLLRAFPTGTGADQFTMDLLAFMGDEGGQKDGGADENT